MDQFGIGLHLCEDSRQSAGQLCLVEVPIGFRPTMSGALKVQQHQSKLEMLSGTQVSQLPD
jgi:hypothetical protein